MRRRCRGAGRRSRPIRGLYRSPARRDQRASRARPAAAAARSRLSHRARAVDRSAAEARGARARNAWPGGAHLRHHAGGDLAAARAPETRLRRRSFRRHRRDRAIGMTVATSLASRLRRRRRRAIAVISRPVRARQAVALSRPAGQVEPDVQPDGDSRTARRWSRIICSTRSRCCRSCPIDSALRVLDVGTGGGVPGIPLAIARPRWHVVLLDSNHKKVAFLQQAAIELALAQRRGRRVARRGLRAGAPFDVVISRAFADLRDLRRIGARHACAGRHARRDEGRAPARGNRAAAAARCACRDAARSHVPGLDAQAPPRRDARHRRRRRRMTRIIAVANQKGGVGKTTTTRQSRRQPRRR